MYRSLVIPLTLTLLLHGVIAACFFIDWSGEHTVIKHQPPKYIEAKLVKLEKATVTKPAKPKVKPKPKPKPKPVAAKKPSAEPVAVNKPKPAQVKQAEDAAKQRQAAELAAEQQRQAQEQQRLIKEAAFDLDEAIEVETQAQQAKTDAELANSHIALITQMIVQNWSRPASARNNMEAELQLDLVPTGEVVNVVVIKSSGNSAFDRSAIAAVQRAGRFPELQQLPYSVFQQYFRRLRMKFKPEDLRR